jgi:Flp pilus assembly pilin Flp
VARTAEADREFVPTKEVATMQQIRRILTSVHADARAVIAVEYGRIAAVAITGFTMIGTNLSSVLNNVASAL